MPVRSLLPYSWTRNALSEIKRDPFAALQDEMNRLFESFGSLPSAHMASDMAPRLDICETDREIDIDAELPGVDEKDVDVTLSGDVLTIRGERKNGREERNKNYYLAERSFGSFTRSVSLPFEADPKNVSAKFDKGVLHIAIPKPENMAAKSARIPVKPA